MQGEVTVAKGIATTDFNQEEFKFSRSRKPGVGVDAKKEIGCSMRDRYRRQVTMTMQDEGLRAFENRRNGKRDVEK